MSDQDLKPSTCFQARRLRVEPCPAAGRTSANSRRAEQTCRQCNSEGSAGKVPAAPLQLCYHAQLSGTDLSDALLFLPDCSAPHESVSHSGQSCRGRSWCRKGYTSRKSTPPSMTQLLVCAEASKPLSSIAAEQHCWRPARRQMEAAAVQAAW